MKRSSQNQAARRLDDSVAASQTSIAIYPANDDPTVGLRAEALAKELGLPKIDRPSNRPGEASRFSLLLMVGPGRLELQETGTRPAGPIYVDFVRGALARRAARTSTRRESLARAIGLRGGTSPTVIDATAGLGRDTFQMASWGCRVIAIERSPVLHAMLGEALHCAAGSSDALREAFSRIELIQGDSSQLLKGLAKTRAADVIYLDPMYPESAKSAAVKKEMRVCRKLVGEDADAGELFQAAIASGVRRVVVKRHRYAPPLGSEPAIVFRGTRVRFDVYLDGK